MHRTTIALIIGVATAAWLAVPGNGTLAQGSAITALATNAITGPLLALAESHKRQTGTQVTVEFDTSPSILRRLAAGEGSGVDVLVTSTVGVDQAIKDGKAIAATRAMLGKVGVGVAVRRGARVPDISSVDALKASILNADAVVYSQGASGVYVEKLLQNLGVAAQVKGKAVQVTTGDAMLEHLSESRGNEVGFTQVSEIKRAESKGHVTLVGLLPASVQNYTVFEAVVMAGSRAPAAARAFVTALTSPAGRKELAANAWEF